MLIAGTTGNKTENSSPSTLYLCHSGAPLAHQSDQACELDADGMLRREKWRESKHDEQLTKVHDWIPEFAAIVKQKGESRKKTLTL